MSVNVGDLISKASALTGITWIGKKKNGYYYLFTRDDSGPTSVYFLVKRFDTIQEMKIYLMDLCITEEVLQE